MDGRDRPRPNAPPLDLTSLLHFSGHEHTKRLSHTELKPASTDGLSARRLRVSVIVGP